MSATREELQGLLERVERAPGVDLSIDVELYRLELGPKHAPIVDHWTLHQIETLVPRYTASIDAALALVDRLLPVGPGVSHELSHSLARDGEECFNFRIRIYHDDEIDQVTVHWATSFSSHPLAILAALLKALIARQDAS